jgi:hypothetical protein
MMKKTGYLKILLSVAIVFCSLLALDNFHLTKVSASSNMYYYDKYNVAYQWVQQPNTTIYYLGNHNTDIQVRKTHSKYRSKKSNTEVLL